MGDPKVASRSGELDFHFVVRLHLAQVQFRHGLDELCVMKATRIFADAILNPDELAPGSGFGGHCDEVVKKLQWEGEERERREESVNFSTTWVDRLPW